MQNRNYGVGLDLGTANVVVAYNDKDGTDKTIPFRDCYYKLQGEQMDFVRSKGEWNLIVIDGEYYALGDDALRAANMIGDAVQRPMANGVLNPKDDIAQVILEEIITKLLGPAAYPGEACVVSIPADAPGVSTLFHKKAAKDIVKKLGYKFEAINEGYATLLALNPTVERSKGDGTKEQMLFTGIAISFGGGQVNLALGLRSDPRLTMSSAQSGDWIDATVAQAFEDVQPNQVTTFKEKFFSFGKTYTDSEIENAGYGTPEKKRYFRKMLASIEAAYEQLISDTLESFVEQFEQKKIKRIDFDFPVEIVISGGTCSPKGFEEKFMEVLEDIDFPLQISRVRKAEETLTSTATGALIRALWLEQEKRQTQTQAQEPTTE